jgi:flagellar basal-body rod protein FlgB
MSSISDQLMFQRSLVPLLKRSLDASALRQKTIAHNIANTETDGYARKEVRFEEALREALAEKTAALKGADGRHLSGPDAMESVRAEVHEALGGDYFNGHNNVDIDEEMVDLARAGLNYRFGVRQLRHQFDQIGLAIRGNR